MKILLFGISNVGKSTIGKMLSKKLKYNFDDLDDEIKRQYGRIDDFMNKYPFAYERHKKKGLILKELLEKYDDNVVIAVSPINYLRFFRKLIENENILAIEILDKPEYILKRLVYADENDKVYPIEINSQKERQYYLMEIKKDITFYKRVYSKIKNKFDINGRTKKEFAQDLVNYIENLKLNLSGE